METLNAKTFKEKVFDFETQKDWKYRGDLPAVVDFYADWCGPCKMLSPVLEELSREYQGKIQIYKVNTEASPELASLFGVRGIPSLLFIPKDGQPTMASGFVPKADLKRAFKDILNVSEPLIVAAR